jgi:hypothetical protein
MMAAMTALGPAERARRTDYIRQSRALLRDNETVAARTARFEKQADSWSAWFRDRLDATGSDNPSDLLPEAFARLEQLNVDAINSAIAELKGTLKRALS